MYKTNSGRVREVGVVEVIRRGGRMFPFLGYVDLGRCI